MARKREGQEQKLPLGKINHFFNGACRQFQKLEVFKVRVDEASSNLI